MAIHAPQTAATNLATGNYHRILKLEGICSPGEPVPRWRILMGFYVSAAARDTPGVSPIEVTETEIPFSEWDPRPEMYTRLLQTERFINTNAASDEPAKGAKHELSGI